MKLKTKLVSSFVLTLLIGGCSQDFMERNPLDSVSSQIFWNSEADVRSGLAGVYSRLQQNFLGYERVYLDGLSDNAFAWDNSNQANLVLMTTGGINPTLVGALPNLYNTPYRAISSCNYFLDNIGKAPISETDKNRYIAEVRFIRALSYFDLVQSYGGVVLYRNYPATLDDAKIARSSREEVYAFIHEDLDFALSHLPDEPFNGHVVKGSAQGLKGRVLLTEKNWSAATAVLQEVISGAKFGLSNDYAAIFTSAGQANANVNREIMFSTRYLGPNNAQRITPGPAGMDIELGWFSLLQPYRDLADSYEMTDGLTAVESPLFDPENPYRNRDPRLDMTVRLPDEVWENPSTGAEWTESYTSFTGFLTEKYVDLSRIPFSTATAVQTDQDYVHLRYADVLLMFAEAINETSGPDERVYAALNQVRSRPGVNMPAVDQAKYGSQEALREFIRRERRVELALEGQRYHDLKRWNIAHVKLPTLQTPAGIPLVFEPRHYLLPFSQGELDNNPQLRQNEGY